MSNKAFDFKKIPSGIIVDRRVSQYIDEFTFFSGVYFIRFTDITDSFQFETKEEVQNFLLIQDRERVFDKELSKGYFDYLNEHGETLRYYITQKHGAHIQKWHDENLGVIQ